MSLSELHKKIQDNLAKIPFGELWEGFHTFSFAVYNDSQASLDGILMDKPNEFIANTAIDFHGKQVAIFRCRGTEDAGVMTSKMVHEMFHAFQNENKESRFPNEFEAVTRYEYTADNLSLKRKENRLLAEMTLHGFSDRFWNEFLSLRMNRLTRHPYSLNYESQVEQIEGTANYIELSVLKRLNEAKYQEKLKDMLEFMVAPQSLLPIRIGLYDSGALLIQLIKENRIPFSERFETDPFSVALLKNVPSREFSETDPEIETAMERYYADIEEIIARIASNQPMAEGKFDLLGINFYNAKYHKDYIYTTYFLMYRDHDREHTLFGNYLIRMREGKIVQIYQDVENTN